MPTYDYVCEECGFEFEHFQMMSEAPLDVCPKCGGKVKRLIGGGIGIIFKGDGFYVTDNKAKSSTGESSERQSKQAETKADKETTAPATKKAESSPT